MRLLLTLLLLLLPAFCLAQAPATQPLDKLPFIQVDLPNKRIAIECQVIDIKAPLEFLCVVTGTNEHEAILRTDAKPSHIHLALLMLGLKPGEPVRYAKEKDAWLPPHGPALKISVEYEKDGTTVSHRAWELMRDVRTKRPMPPQRWIFVGSKTYNTGQYAADVTGYVVSIVNFDLSLIDVPQLASSANEQLLWEINPDTVPPEGAKAKLIIEPGIDPPHERTRE